jgi:hypothetical protein
MRKILKYAALVLGLIMGFFLFLMSLDSFPNVMEMRAIGGFMIHLTPSLVMFVSSVIAFRHPGAGAIIFLALTAAFTVYFRTYMDIQNFTVISLPLLIITLLLFTSLQKKGKHG